MKSDRKEQKHLKLQIEGTLKELKKTLGQFESTAERYLDITKNLDSKFEKLAEVRDTATKSFMRETQVFHQGIEDTKETADSGQSQVKEVFEQLQHDKEESKSIFSNAVSATTRVIRETDESRRRYLDDVQERILSYDNITEEGREIIRKNLDKEGEGFSELMPSIERIQTFLMETVKDSQNLASVQESLFKDESLIRALFTNKEGCRELQKGHVNAAINLFKISCQAKPSAETYFDLAMALYLSGSYEESIDALNESLSAGLDPCLANILKSLIAIKNKNYHTAVEFIENALVSSPDNWLSRIVASIAYYANGEITIALKHLQSAQQIRPFACDDWGFLKTVMGKITLLKINIPGMTRKK